MTSAISSSVTDYAEAVIAGEVLTGTFVRLACERHLADLQRDDLEWREREADRAIRFISQLTLFEAQKPFVLEPWQAFIVGSLFGWYLPNGMRRFTQSYVEVARGNGKTPLSAAIGLYCQVALGIHGAQVFSAATTRDQAKICFRDATNMVTASRDLSEKVERMVNVLDFKPLGSVFRPLSAEANKMDGLRVLCALVDELHEHPSGDVLTKLRTGMGKFSGISSLLFMITTAGYDRNSVCWEQHDYSVKLLEGRANDDSYFAYVATLDEAHTRTYSFDDAMRCVVKYCTCQTKDIVNIQETVLTILNAQLPIRGSVKSAMSATYEMQTQNIERVSMLSMLNGSKNILSADSKSSVNMPPQIARKGMQRSASDDSIREGSSNLRNSPTRSSTPHKQGLAAFVASSNDDWSSITTMIRDRFAAYSAENATVDSVCSEILRKVYSEHSTTCNVRLFKVSGCTLQQDIDADDWTDESCWPKANPNLGVSIQLATLRQECEQAKAMPAQQNPFKRLRLNIWTEQADRFLDMATWDAGKTPVGNLLGRTCYGGLDLSSTTDLSAFVLAFPPVNAPIEGPLLPDDLWKVLCWFWLPEDNIRQRVTRDRVPYDVWADQGFLELTQGNVIDYDYIRARVNALTEQYRIVEIGYDPWNATQLVTQLMEDGAEMVPVRQGFASLTAPTKELEKLVAGHGIEHGGNPVLRWCAANVSVEQDPAGNIKISKAKSTERIDGIAALVNALFSALRHGSEDSVYEQRGLLSF